MQAVRSVARIYMMNNICLHINNWGLTGGIGSTIMDLAKAFPQFFHIMLALNRSGEDYEAIAYFRERGVKYMSCSSQPLLTNQILREVKPFAVFLHNTRGDQITPDCLNPYRVIAVHHNVTRPFVKADIHWFVSDYVRRAYRNYEGKMRAFTLPPTVWSQPFLKVTPTSRPVTIGRIQSQTHMHRGKMPDKFFELIKDYHSFVVPRDAPIKPGKMPDYLSKMDIFVLWGNTTESWSRVVTEANLARIPVVARDNHDGVTEQLHKSGGGLLVNTEQEFTETIKMLVDNRERREEIGQKGRIWCLDNTGTRGIQEKLTEQLMEWGIDVI